MSRLHRSNLARTALTSDQDALQALRKRFRASQFMRFVLRPLSLSILVLALLVGMLAILTGVTLDERWSALTVFLFFVVIEAIVTTNWLRHPDRLRLDRTAYRGAELLLILIVVRLVSWIIFDEKNMLDEKYYPYAEEHQKAPWRTKQILKANFSHLMNKRMDQITPWIMDKWQKEQLERGISPSTINRATTTIKAVLTLLQKNNSSTPIKLG